jgi:hypothetical protein
MDESHDKWPVPPAPLRAMEWEPDEAGTWVAVGPSGMKWTVSAVADGRYAITLNDWSRPDWWEDSSRAAMELVETFEARHDDPAVAVLGTSWTQAADSHTAYRDEAEARVREWAWGPSGAWWERLEPFWSEQAGERPKTRRLRGKPERKSDAQLYGFDETGRVVVSRQFGDGFGNDDVVRRETLRVSGLAEDVVLVYETEGARGVYRHGLGELHSPLHEDGELQRLDIWFKTSYAEGFRWWGTAYEYEDRRIAVIRSAQRGAPDKGWQHKRSGHQLAELRVTHRSPLRLGYAEDGQLLTITGKRVIYRRRARAATARAMRLVRDELPERIAAWVRRTAPSEPLYCLAISYAEYYNDPLPPSLGLATLRELHEWRASSTGGPLHLTVFNPAEFACFDTEPAELTEDAALLDAYQVLNQEWVSTDDERQPRQLVVAVAKILAQRTWDELSSGPDGFAVYAVDLELTDLDRNLKATVPTQVRRSLSAQRAR